MEMLFCTQAKPLIFVAAIAMVCCGCESKALTFDPVPADALSGGLEIDFMSGKHAIRFPRFERWLLEGGEDAQNRALHDDRLLTDVKDFLEWGRADPWRVKDMAYHLLGVAQGRGGFGPTDDLAKRDAAINALLRARENTR